MRKSVRLAAVATGAVLLAAPPLATATAATEGVPPSGAKPRTLALPEPTGEHPVGTTTLHLRDESRADPWVPEVKRELMVGLWYPATENGGGAPAQYMTAEESRLFIEFQQEQGGPDLPKDILSTVRTHARTDAAALPSETGHPLVVLSPGFSWPRATLTGMAEELASQGYAVALIGHNHESTGTTFPDGRTTECVACEVAEPHQVPPGRAQDVSFVLDHLTQHRGELIDEQRIAMVGHSIGGASASETMLRDERVDAGVNLDGTVYNPVEPGLDRPFLFLGGGVHAPHGLDPTWDATWEKLTGWKRWMTLNGGGHSVSTDLRLLHDQAGLPNNSYPLPGARGAELSNEVVAAFVGTHLRGEHHPLLDRETEERPELLFWHLDRPDRPGR